MLTIAIGNDHTAVSIRRELIRFLQEDLNCTVIDMGTEKEEPADYPVYAQKVAQAVLDGKAGLGIVICGTGVGICIAANKVKGIRCAMCQNPEVAKMIRRHNNPNILAFGARVQSVEEMKNCIRAFLGENFEGGRHQRRLDIIRQIEEEQC